MTEYEEIEGGNVWQFENEGDSIEGELIDIVAGQYGNNYIIKDDKGDKYTIFGGSVINTKMANIEKGKKIKVTFLKEVKSSSGRTYKDFKVEVEK